MNESSTNRIFVNFLSLQIKNIYHMHVSTAVFNITLHCGLSVKNNLLCLSVSQDISHFMIIPANKEVKKRTKKVHNYVK